MKSVNFSVDDEVNNRRIKTGKTWKQIVTLGILAAEKECAKIESSETSEVQS